MFPIVTNLPSLTTTQMIDVDRAMTDEVGIDLPRMMENAGRNLADLAIAVHHPATVCVLAGSGGNGGGVLVAARHLLNRGVAVRASLTRGVDHMTEVTATQATILTRLGIEFDAEPRDADLILDGLIGYSIDGAPHGRSRDLIEWSHGRTVLSLDVPSGVDATTGARPGAVVMAATTMTLALPKTGILDNPAVGRLFLADISVPPALYRRFDIDIETPFAGSAIVEIL